MMTRKLLLAVSFFACVPSLTFGQDRRTASPTAGATPPASTSQFCCGRTDEEIARFSSPEEEIQFTQRTIQGILLLQGTSARLAPGVHLISTSPAGHMFQATVNRRGAVINWFVTDPSGPRIAQVSANGGSGQVDVNRCMEAYIRDAEFCEWQGTFDSRYNYGRCYWNAWLRFLTCLESGLQSGAGGAIIR